MSTDACLNRIRPGVIGALALLGASSCRVTPPASRAPLLAALRTVIADSLRPEAASRGQQFTVETDTDGAWARSLAAAATPTSSRQPTLVLSLGRAALHPDSAIIHARLIGCTPQVPGMNFYEHTIRLRFVRANDDWQYRGRTIDAIADGGC